jgi:hypothetical protein
MFEASSGPGKSYLSALVLPGLPFLWHLVSLTHYLVRSDGVARCSAATYVAGRNTS